MQSRIAVKKLFKQNQSRFLSNADIRVPRLIESGVFQQRYKEHRPVYSHRASNCIPEVKIETRESEKEHEVI